MRNSHDVLKHTNSETLELQSNELTGTISDITCSKQGINDTRSIIPKVSTDCFIVQHDITTDNNSSIIEYAPPLVICNCCSLCCDGMGYCIHN